MVVMNCQNWQWGCHLKKNASKAAGSTLHAIALSCGQPKFICLERHWVTQYPECSEMTNLHLSLHFHAHLHYTLNLGVASGWPLSLHNLMSSAENITQSKLCNYESKETDLFLVDIMTGLCLFWYRLGYRGRTHINCNTYVEVIFNLNAQP